MKNNHIERNSSDTGRRLLSAVLILFATAVIVAQIIMSVNFSRNVKGYLKLAADASTVELAEEELGKALNYLEANNLTEGYTSIFYETPTEDIGFWYKNLKASKQELAKARNSSQLEKTNMLIKLRETLLDNGNEGKAHVTYPDGLQRYPYNLLFALLSWAAIFAFCGGIYYMFSKEQWKAMNEAGQEKKEE